MADAVRDRRPPSSEVLALDVEHLDRRNRRAKVTRKGAAVDIIVWQTGTARLLPKLLDRRGERQVFWAAGGGEVRLQPRRKFVVLGQGGHVDQLSRAGSRPSARWPSPAIA